jgi:hypothetical protein
VGSRRRPEARLPVSVAAARRETFYRAAISELLWTLGVGSRSAGGARIESDANSVFRSLPIERIPRWRSGLTVTEPSQKATERGGGPNPPTKFLPLARQVESVLDAALPARARPRRGQSCLHPFMRGATRAEPAQPGRVPLPEDFPGGVDLTANAPNAA